MMLRWSLIHHPGVESSGNGAADRAAERAESKCQRRLAPSRLRTIRIAALGNVMGSACSMDASTTPRRPMLASATSLWSRMTGPSVRRYARCWTREGYDASLATDFRTALGNSRRQNSRSISAGGHRHARQRQRHCPSPDGAAAPARPEGGLHHRIQHPRRRTARRSDRSCASRSTIAADRGDRAGAVGLTSRSPLPPSHVRQSAARCASVPLRSASVAVASISGGSPRATTP